MVKIIYDCPECGCEVEIEQRGMQSWGEGFDKEVECPDCGDKTTVTYMMEARD